MNNQAVQHDGGHRARSERRYPFLRASRLFQLSAVMLDLALVSMSFVAMSLLKFGTPVPTDDFVPIYLRLQLFLMLVLPLALVLTGAYRDLYRAPLGHQASTAAKACLWAGGATLLGLFVYRHIGFSRTFVVAHLIQLSILIPFSRILLSRLAETWRVRGHGVRPVVLAGERETVAEVGLRLRLASYLGYRIAGIHPYGWEPLPQELPTVKVLRDKESLERFILDEGVERVFVADRVVDGRRHKEVCEIAERTDADVRLVVCPVNVPDLRTRIHDVLAVPLVTRRSSLDRAAQSGFKRAFDMVGASLLLVLSSPLFLLISVLVKLSSPGPVFYRQTRLGLDARPFGLLKFRSMVSDAERFREELEASNEASGPLFKIRRDPRVTGVGHWLRKLSLDELPQLWNVVRGEMSLVGPRPPLPEEAELYEDWQRLRFGAPQGITGLWQVSGRSRLSFEEMVQLDLHYIENWSILLDLEILLETVPTMLHGDGAF